MIYVFRLFYSRIPNHLPPVFVTKDVALNCSNVISHNRRLFGKWYYFEYLLFLNTLRHTLDRWQFFNLFLFLFFKATSLVSMLKLIGQSLSPRQLPWRVLASHHLIPWSHLYILDYLFQMRSHLHFLYVKNWRVSVDVLQRLVWLLR